MISPPDLCLLLVTAVTLGAMKVFVEEGVMPLQLSGAVPAHLQTPVWRTASEMLADGSRGCAV